MLNIDESKWVDAGNNEEERTYKNMTFYRAKGDIPVSLDCQICKNLIYTVEDVERAKKENCCDTCYNTYYYGNKEKWKQGWRPKISNKY